MSFTAGSRPLTAAHPTVPGGGQRRGARCGRRQRRAGELVAHRRDVRGPPAGGIVVLSGAATPSAATRCGPTPLSPTAPPRPPAAAGRRAVGRAHQRLRLRRGPSPPGRRAEAPLRGDLHGDRLPETAHPVVRVHPAPASRPCCSALRPPPPRLPPLESAELLRLPGPRVRLEHTVRWRWQRATWPSGTTRLPSTAPSPTTATPPATWPGSRSPARSGLPRRTA